MSGALALAVALAACAPVPPGTAPGSGAPTVAFALTDGSSLASQATRGNIVALAFFTKWCPASASMLRAVAVIGTEVATLLSAERPSSAPAP